MSALTGPNPTLAAASFTILRDVLHSGIKVGRKKRKKAIELAHLKLLLKPAIIDAVESVRSGDPNPFNIGAFDKYVQQLADELPTPLPSIENIDLSIKEDDVAAWWSAINKGSNFLKHAEHDFNKSLAVSELHTESKIVQAIGAYWQIKGVGPEPEPAIFVMYRQAMDGDEVIGPPIFDEFAKILVTKRAADRLKLCNKAIESFNRQLSLQRQQAAEKSGGPDAQQIVEGDI